MGAGTVVSRSWAVSLPLPLLLLPALLLTLAAPTGVARAYSKGISGYYGGKLCISCHATGGSMMNGTLKLTSPAYAGQTYTFTFSCTAGTGAGALPTAGVDIHATCGTIAAHPGETTTKLLGHEVIHVKPKATTSKSVTYQFLWTAPAGPTGCGFSVGGLLANDDKQTTGDITCMALKGLLVKAVPDGGIPGDTGAESDAAVEADAAARDAASEAISAEAGTDGEAGPETAPPDRGAGLDGPAPAGGGGCGCDLGVAPGDGGLAGLLLALLGLSRRRAPR